MAFTPISIPLDVARIVQLDAPPLVRTLARALARCERWSVRLNRPADPEWVDATAVPSKLDELLGRAGAHYCTADRAVTGTFFLSGYVRGVAAAALVCLATERRVPDVSPDNIAFRFGPEGMARAIMLGVPTFAALPDDPDAEHPDAVVLPDVAALRGWLRDRLVHGHLAGLVPMLRERTRRGPRALWGTASDMCSSSLALLAEIEGTLAAADYLYGEARAFLATGPPLVDAPALCPLLHAGRLASGWRRVTCCLAYRLGDGFCTSCPAIDQDVRQRRLRAELEAPPGT